MATSMPQPLSLSRAARLAGVTRGELQQRIRQGEVVTFEGKIEVSDLLRIYPNVSLDRSEMLEKVEYIKVTAQPKTFYSDGAPSLEILLSRLQQLTDILLQTKTALNTAEDLLQESLSRIESLATEAPHELSNKLAELAEWLASALNRQPSSPDQRARLFAKDAFLRIMAAGIKIIPSGHEFFVEGTETILEASMRAGLHLSYGCSSGNCGSCKARVVKGQVWKLREHDYLLSESERAMGYILTCCNTAVTDVLLEAAEAMAPKDLPHQEIRCTVKGCEPLTNDVSVLKLQTPRTRSFRFLAGQRARLSLESGATIELPIASCPCEGRKLQFFVPRQADVPFSAQLFAGLTPGQTLLLDGPQGDFVLFEDSPTPLLFIAFGNGFASVKSLIEHAISIDNAESFHLYWASNTQDGFFMQKLCRSWKDALDNFSYSEVNIAQGMEGLEYQVAADHPDLSEYNAYIAGPAELVDSILPRLETLHLPPERMRVERFA